MSKHVKALQVNNQLSYQK